MAAKVTRRDFLNGVAVSVGGVALYGCGSEIAPVKVATQPTAFSPPGDSAYYPPTLTGMRGSHEGSFEVAHDLAWRGQKPEQYETLNEHYDLVVVGAGMSGLAAARFYQQKWETTRVSLCWTTTMILADMPSATSFTRTAA